MGGYESENESHGFPLHDRHFPAYLRLFKWKILDICMQKMSDELFLRFRPIIKEDLISIMEHIRDTEKYVDAEKPDMNVPQLDPDRFDEEELKTAEVKRKQYIQILRNQEIRITKRRYAEHFLNRILFNDEGIRIVDKMLFDEHEVLYDQIHWKNCPDDWPARDTFFKRFYYDENDADAPKTFSGIQKLDRVASAARGNHILTFFKSSQMYEKELAAMKTFLDDKNLDLESIVIKEMINEGPCYYLEKTPDGEEVKKPAIMWNIHKTRMLIASLPMFYVTSTEVGKQDDWYFNLLDAMSRDPDNRAALLFLHPDYESALEEKEQERQRDKLLRLEGFNLVECEQVVSENQETRELRPQPTNDILNETYDDDLDELQLRIYQEELVLPALKGDNVVIVAPTGSGKTEVAIYAALQHIDRRAEKKQPSRVAMLVPKIPLVGQQRDRFLKYCKGKYNVEGFHGAEKSSDGNGRKDEVLMCHVVVMTPQILLNMWQSVRESERIYICDFSMVIFDEVHKTTGNHPYGEIARMIQDYNGPKPQIIGLTASLNVKATSTSDQTRMLSEIYRLLALLDSYILSTIQNESSIMELNKHVAKPDDSVRICQPPLEKNATIRSFINRVMNNLHSKLLKGIDGLIKSRNGNVFPQNFMRMANKLAFEDTDYYTSWLQQVMHNLNKINSSEKAIVNFNAKYLKALVEARSISDVMPAYVAFDYLAEEFNELRKKITLPEFSGDFDKNRETLEKRKHDKEDNADPEIVTELKNILKQQFVHNPDSRAIIFVTQRITAERVSDFLNKSNLLPATNGDAVGFVLGSNNQGSVRQTQTQQKKVIERFNDGKLKVIVATSVVEEGLDIATCNLIIKYNCSSGSAVQLTQQRGRARAKNSRSVLLVVSSKVRENENNALIAEKHMQQCVQTIQKNGLKHLKQEVKAEKARIIKSRDHEEREKQSREKELQSRMYAIHCSKCNLYLCKSNAVKKLFSNYLILDPNIWDKLDLEPRKKNPKYMDENAQPLCSLKCIQCQENAGKAFKQRGVYAPHIDVRFLSFIEENSQHSAMETKSKWSIVESDLFYIAEARDSHFAAMLNALNNSERNLAKKRLLDLELRQIMDEYHKRDIEERRRREAEERKRNEQKNIIRTTWDESDENEDEDEGESF